jgi:predicted RNA-binding protein with PUA-like domain
MRAVAPFPTPVTLAQMKTDPALADFSLIKFSRLSVAPVTAEQWAYICKLGGYKAKK